MRPVAFITGASSGIGLATAHHLAVEGFDLALFDVDEAALQNATNAIRQHRKAVLGFPGDVASSKDMDVAVASVLARFGRLDAVVANAGVNGVWAPIDDLALEEWDQTIRTNLRGTFLTIARTVPILKRQGGGSIVIVSSINGVRTFTTPGATAYSATKAAQVAMAQQLALELGRHQIRVNVVCPGAIDTNIASSTEIRHRDETEFPAFWPDGSVPISGGRPGKAEDVARAIGFLLSDSANHITGTPIFVDGGQGLLR